MDAEAEHHGDDFGGLMTSQQRTYLRMIAEVFPGTRLQVGETWRELVPKHDAPPPGYESGARTGGSAHASRKPATRMITKK